MKKRRRRQSIQLRQMKAETMDEGVFLSVPALSTFSPSPSEMAKESSQDEGLGLDSEHSGEEALSECSSSAGSGGLATRKEPTAEADGPEEIGGAETQISDTTSAENIPEILEERMEEREVEVKGNFLDFSESTGLLGEDQGEEERKNSDLPDCASNKQEIERDDGGEGHSQSPTRSSPPPCLPPLEGRVSPADREEADEEDGDSEDSDESDEEDGDSEDGDSEDSDESDEELRTDSVQEQSEESEEENPPVPIVVSDCSDTHDFRSVLKMPNLLGDSLSDEPKPKKKVVSFFDDITIYLFDQESPTRELAGAESSRKGAKPHPQENVSASDDFSDGNISEESAELEQEDDFPLLPIATAVISSIPETKLSTANLSSMAKAAEGKPAVQYSRFTVSPSHVSRFSVTPVSRFSVTPVSRFSVTPVSRFSVTPVSRFSVTPVSRFSVTPVSRFSVTPVSRFSVTPVSRFSVTPVSRFSVTLVPDSDVDSAGGSSKDGKSVTMPCYTGNAFHRLIFF